MHDMLSIPLAEMAMKMEKGEWTKVGYWIEMDLVLISLYVLEYVLNLIALYIWDMVHTLIEKGIRNFLSQT